MKKPLLTIFGMLILASVFAQAPQAFNYQGVARDLTGNPITNTNIGLQIAILQGSANGVEVYKETHNVTTTNLGLFSLQIGTGVLVSGNFAAVDWGNASHFLQIEMDENGGTNYQLIGTSELLSVPYALYAANGSKWNDNNVGIDYADGNVGIGTDAPAEKLSIVGNNTDGDGNISSSLLSISNNNYSRYRTSTFSNTSFRNSQIVGIRGRGEMDNPQSVFPDDRVFGVYGQIYDGNTLNNSPISSIEYFVGNTASSGIITFSTLDGNETIREERLRIDEIGNIGIGTQNPAAKLQVTDGDIYLEDINSGVIMKSPNGQCWRMTIDDFGQSQVNATVCPN